MSAPNLVLSTFPGLGLLDRAFEDEGYCVVDAPDVLWGGRIERFHPPPGVFAGVIGGPPCQSFSPLHRLVKYNGFESRFGNLIPQFERVVREAAPDWFLMENVKEAPLPDVPGYVVTDVLLNNRWFADTTGQGARQYRVRRWSFGTPDGQHLRFDIALFESATRASPALGSTGMGCLTGVDYEPRSVSDLCALQGVPRDFTQHMPFTQDALRQAIANGVPIPMGRALARAVRRATSSVPA